MISGYFAMLTTLLLWAGFFLSLRAGVHSSLTLADIALSRFLFPCILLLPLVVRWRKKIMTIPVRYLLGLFFGSGLPYFIVAGSGMKLAPVADGSTLIPGTLPLFVSAIAVLFFAQPLSAHRKTGLVMIVIGIAFFFVQSFTSQHASLSGYLIFLLGSCMWACFTICARVASLNPFVSAGFISLLSTISLVVLIATGALDSHLINTQAALWPYEELSFHFLLQGVGAGLVAAVTYLHAISKLGAERTAAFGAATPAIATLLAIPLFGEIPSWITLIAMACIAIGSIIASNIFLSSDASLSYRPPSYR